MLCWRDGWLDLEIEYQRSLPKFDGIVVHFDSNLLIIIPILKNSDGMGLELLQQSIPLVSSSQLQLNNVVSSLLDLFNSQHNPIFQVTLVDEAVLDLHEHFAK